jgi:RES domain-containing protein
VLPDLDLPSDWNQITESPQAQAFGKAWVEEARSAVLSVPSSIVPTERCFVLNPAHPDFAKIEFRESSRFRFDPRLK